MPDAPAPGNRSSIEWEAFIRQHAGHRFLEQDPLYSLDAGLITAIKDAIPRFFTRRDERFERSLAKAAGFAFVFRRPVATTEDHATRGFEPPVDRRTAAAERKINKLLDQEMRDGGADRVDIDSYHEQRKTHATWNRVRQRAFAGWLVMNRSYRAERDALRAASGTEIGRVGVFPRMPKGWALNLVPEPPLSRACLDACYAFFARWNLETLSSWDWPVPLDVDVGIAPDRDHDLLKASGRMIHVPWYLLRGETLDLRQVADWSRAVATPAHLRDWVRKREARTGDPLGDVRYDTIRMLYRYYALVLARRYSEACQGNLERLDRVFAAHLKRDIDTVKKLRLELQRALGSSE